MTWSALLPITAALLHGTGFILYSLQSKDGSSKPNPISWFLWAFLSTLNAVSFFKLNNNGALATLQFATGSLGCIGTFFYVLVIGKFAWPKLGDVLMVVVGLYGIYLWYVAGLEKAYVVFVAVIIWSFIPTVVGTWKDPRKERPRAWYFWTVAFTLTAIYTYFFRGGWTTSMIVPIGAILAHGSVIPLCTESRKHRWMVSMLANQSALLRTKGILEEVKRLMGALSAEDAARLARVERMLKKIPKNLTPPVHYPT